jgi:hypothetical protein
MLTFTVTVYGPNEHAERNAAQRLWGALEDVQSVQDESPKAFTMLIGKAEYTEGEPINLRTAAEIEDERLRRKGYRK